MNDRTRKRCLTVTDLSLQVLMLMMLFQGIQVNMNRFPLKQFFFYIVATQWLLFTVLRLLLLPVLRDTYAVRNIKPWKQLFDGCFYLPYTHTLAWVAQWELNPRSLAVFIYCALARQDHHPNLAFPPACRLNVNLVKSNQTSLTPWCVCWTNFKQTFFFRCAYRLHPCIAYFFNLMWIDGLLCTG